MHKPLLSWLLSLCFLLSLTLTTSLAAAQSPPPEQPKLLENYSPLELTITGVGVAGAITMLGFGSKIFGDPEPSMGTPSTESVDWRFSHWLNPDPDPKGQFLGGAPDYAGYAMPVIALGFYGLGAVGNLFSDDFFMEDRKHELVAFTETVAWTMIAVNALKLMVGRPRPFTVRPDVDKSQYKEGSKEYNLSFPSGHSASAAMTMTFVFLDASDYLVREVFADSSAPVQVLVGRVLPATVAAGVTWTVMYSRVKDQRHWLSDTITGALIGSTVSALFYTMHFDTLGNPRRRHKLEDDEATTSTSAIMRSQALSPSLGTQGQLGLNYSFLF